MKEKPIQSIINTLAVILLLGAITTTSHAQGQRRGGVYGYWNISMEIGERTMQSILNFSRNQNGEMNGQWISFFGSTPLSDVSLEDNKLQFTMTRRGRNGETTSKFTGSLAEGKLSGALSSEQGESKVTGERAPRVSRAAGDWAMAIKAGEREYKGTLSIQSGSEGELSGEWTSERGTSKVTDVTYSRGELGFKRLIKTEDNSWEMIFTGNIRGNAITGTAKSERGEAEVTGERVGGAAIGTWDLALESDGNTRSHRLRVNPDMSALYGSTAIEKVKLEGKNLSFTSTLKFGDREFSSEFKGKIDGDALTGEVTSGQGTRKVTGKKQAPTFRRNRP